MGGSSFLDSGASGGTKRLKPALELRRAGFPGETGFPAARRGVTGILAGRLGGIPAGGGWQNGLPETGWDPRRGPGPNRA